MKKLLTLLYTHLRNDFDFRAYGLLAIFLAVYLVINYQIQLENTLIDSYAGQPIRVLWYFLLYGVAYYGSVCLMQLNGRLRGVFQTKAFWIYSLTAISILSIEPELSYSLAVYVANRYVHIHYFAYKMVHEAGPVLSVWLPLLLFYFLYDSRTENFYGLTFRKVDFRPYGWLLLIMAVPIAWASFQLDFLETYPTYRQQLPVTETGMPKGVLIGLYEGAYGSAFVATELIFRGFMVIGIATVVGKDAILPMVVTYAVLHFGKPVGEAIGSIFGGYILGVIALHTRNIWGGVAIHLGVAWLMELAAWLQKSAEGG